MSIISILQRYDNLTFKVDSIIIPMHNMKYFILAIFTIVMSFVCISCNSDDEPYMEGAGCIRNGKYTNVDVFLNDVPISSVSDIVLMSNPIDDEPDVYKAILRIKGLEKKGKVSYINGIYTYDSFYGSVEIKKNEYEVNAEFIGNPATTPQSEVKILVYLNSK